MRVMTASGDVTSSKKKQLWYVGTRVCAGRESDIYETKSMKPNDSHDECLCQSMAKQKYSYKITVDFLLLLSNVKS